MRIAVIGWGSLIWDPRDLQIEDEWHSDGPMLPVEFARVSSGNRLTLVLIDTAPLQPTLWAFLRTATLAEAIKSLAEREGTSEANIGHWSQTDDHTTLQGDISKTVNHWAKEKGIDGVVWTALGPKKPNGEEGLATEDELIEYLRNLLKHRDATAAKEYIETAPSQIQTPLRARIQTEFGWSPVNPDTHLDLQSVLDELPEDPEEQKRRNQMASDLDALRDRLATDGSHVSDAEILDGIRKQFELCSTTDFLAEAPWLIQALSFTSSIIPISEIPSAWRKFQKHQSKLAPFGLDEYPILDAIAYWYFEHREGGLYDEQHMVTHALAVYEYLAQQVRGWEADDEYSDLFSGVGMRAFYLHYGLQNKERAKFYAQLLEMEYLAGRLDSEDFLSVQEMASVIQSIEDKERSEHERILQLNWETISDRERQIEQRNRRIQELERRHEEVVTRTSTVADINRGTERVSKLCGLLWTRFHPLTKRNLVLGDVFSRAPLRSAHPDIPPSSFFKALNAELRARLFAPNGSLDPGLLERLKSCSPASLLLEYNRIVTWDKEDKAHIRAALDLIGKESVICSRDNLERIRQLRHHRNWIEHPEPRGRSYSEHDLEDLLKVVWHSNWLIRFLGQLHSR